MALAPPTPESPPDRVIKLPGGRVIHYDRLTPAEREDADKLLAEFELIVKRSPIQGFEPHGPAQARFIEAQTKMIAAIAGNRFGKTTSLVVWMLKECLPKEALPSWLRALRRFDERVDVWIMVPSEDKILDSLKPAFEKWVGARYFKGGSWGRAYNGESRTLTLVNPHAGTGVSWSTVAFKTYKMDASTLGGASLWAVGYDEPPPRAHREEGRTRLVDHDGVELFAFTPITTNVAYAKKIIWNRREDPDITLVRGSIHDNTVLPAHAIAAWEREFADDPLLAARRDGDFVDVGGQIYPLLERRVIEPWDPAAKAPGRFETVVVAIDPGVRNCGITFVDWDNHDVGTVFDELLIQDGDVETYAQEIRATLARWGIPVDAVHFVIDPKSAQVRSMVDKQTVQTALASQGIFCSPAEQAVEAGVFQVNGRLKRNRLWVCRNCTKLRAEADEYVAKPRDDGVFEVLKQHDHLCDSLRYACMTHPYYPDYEAAAPSRDLGAPAFVPNRALAASEMVVRPDVGPLGPMG